MISGGLKENITLDGSLSYDPEAAHGDQSGINFTGYYGKITGNYSSAGKKERFLYSGKRGSFQYNGRASGVPIYLDTEAMSLTDIYIVKLVLAKDYCNASAYQSQCFFTLIAECFPLSCCYLPVCSYELRVRS